MTERRRDIAINVPVLARVEGEGALELTIRDDGIQDLKLRIFEPPRLFEKFLEGREHTEVPDIVARICGICPVAYQMSATQALEAILEVTTTPWIEAMRRVMYCGEWVESHALHIHLLAAPDFLGYDNAMSMSRDHGEAVRRGLYLQGLGNRLIKLFGARSVHPVGVRIGGFHHAPPAAEVNELTDELERAMEQSRELVKWAATLPLPEDHQDFTSVALRADDEYAITHGRLVSDQGLDVTIDRFEDHMTEHQVPHSTALHALLDGRPYLVGPLARMNINHDRLPQPIQSLLQETGMVFPSGNMFHSIVARAAEIHYALWRAHQLLSDYTRPESPHVAAQPRAGEGVGCTEAPRGILWHRYALDDQGVVTRARIVPPTSQNQARIEDDLRRSLTQGGLDRDEEALRLHGEMVIRNYDPCISCSTHFLDLRVNRS